MSIRNVSDKESLNKEDGQKLRAILELQWRAYQIGLNAELLLQSQLSKLTIATTGEAIKLVREVYNNRYVSLKYEDLEAGKLEDFACVCWSDIAVGSWRDFSSSGGYFLAARNQRF